MSQDAAKRAVGVAAAAMVEDGMRVGLGTGSTAHWFIVSLAARARDGLRVTCTATSDASAQLAVSHGLEVRELGADGLDFAGDGADAVDPDLRLIKGGGGAHVREKIVAAAAERFVVLVDESKLCETLPGWVPIEIVPFGAERTLATLALLGGTWPLRESRSDNGNLLADGRFADPIDDPEGLAAQLDAVPGVVGHGLFLGMTDLLLVARADGSIEERAPPR
ncbi:MAG: ribose-5-phosphate isomerase RpiA [Candidatus Dormibacteraeota bacterium]|nr:ribose-5-phosphate isomerase RpiA [Candidatus Dormibacteraeota bacterium]